MVMSIFTFTNKAEHNCCTHSYYQRRAMSHHRHAVNLNYHRMIKVLERQRAADLGYESPIHDTKAATDANYDRRA